MNRLEFFLAAMAAGLYRRQSWVISAFAIVSEDPNNWELDPHPYRIVQQPTQAFYVNPDNNKELLPIEGTKGGEPPFTIKERVQLKAGQVPNLSADVETIYGNILFNYIAVVWPFGTKIPFMTGRVSADQMEKIILERLVDDPKSDMSDTGLVAKTISKAQPIYVSEYLKFCDAMFYLGGFTQICVPSASAKALQPPPGIEKLKARLIEENKDRLHDPATIAKIDAELVAADAEYLKGDESEGFLITKKSRNIVRRKLYLMHGAEAGFGDTTNVELVQNSLSQGWDISKFPAMNDSLRAGSYNRGYQTMKGGEAVKWLLRASSNLAVTEEDCGTKLGLVVTITDDNKSRYMGFNVVTEQGYELLTEESIGRYINKVVMVRSPMYCKLDKTDYCACCVGPRLAANPTALSSAVSAYGSAFLDIFMSAAHGKALLLAKMDYKRAII